VNSVSFVSYGLRLILRGRTGEEAFQMLMHWYLILDRETEHCSDLPCGGGMGAANGGIIRVIRPQKQ
jgi:hypothetical protein